MGRALAAAAFLLILCFGAAGALIFFTREEDRIAVDNVLAENFTRAIAEAEDVNLPVRVADLTSFPWDLLLMFEPGTPFSEVSRELGFEFKGDLAYNAESGDLLVFLHRGALVRFADYRGRGRFEGIDRPVARLSPQTAVFEVRDLVARPAR